MEDSPEKQGKTEPDRDIQESQLKESIFRVGKPIVYMHTLEVTPDTLEAAIKEKKTIEIDISAEDDGTLYIGHPASWYTYHNALYTQSLPLDTVTEQVKEHGLFAVLDCKDRRAIPKIKEIINTLGSQNTLVHTWVNDLLFHPYPESLAVEPHWPLEDLPTEEVKMLKKETGVPIIVAARGLNVDRLTGEEGKSIVQKLIGTAEGLFDAINFNLPEGEIPPLEVMNELLSHRILTALNVDTVPENARPELYIGFSDDTHKTSHPKEVIEAPLS